MGIYLDKRGGQLFIQFDYKKQTYKRYLPKGISRTDAKKVETKMRSDLLFESCGITPANDVTFEDFVVNEFLPYCQRNLSKANYDKADRLCIEALPFLRGRTLRSIRHTDIEAFKAYRTALPTMHGRKRQPATIVRELSVLSKLFSIALKNDLCDHNPVARVERPRFDNRQTTILPREDERAFLAAFDPVQGEMARDICELVLNTGLRQNDALTLSGFNVVENGTYLRLIQGKTQRAVKIPLNDVARAIIAKYNNTGLMFPSPKTGAPMLYIRKAIAGACKRAGIEPIGIRDLRRTFGNRLSENGVDALTIAMLLGHTDMRMVHRYANSPESLKSAVETLSAERNSATILRNTKLRAVNS